MEHQNIYTEPQFDPNTLRNLGPLTGLSGTWLGEEGVDVHPVEGGSLEQAFVERYEMQPIDPQTNGPQLFYGLRYHTRVTLPNETTTFHDQVGYWLWEPATESILMTIAIPRGQVAMCVGKAKPSARQFTVRAIHGLEFNGILSNPFLEKAFKTTRFEKTVTIDPAGYWSYEQTTTLVIAGRNEPFLHTDTNRFKRMAMASPNPAAVK